MDNKDIKNETVKDSNAPQIDIPKLANQEEQADFSKIFNVASEEKVEVPKIKEEKKATTEEQPEEKPVVEKKPSEFNGEEKVLYEIKPEKESSVIVPILFFLVLGVFILQLPSLSKHIDFSYINPNEGTTTETPEETDDFFYFDKSSVRAEIGDLEFTNFVKSNIDGEYRISFNINNTALRTYQFVDKYYVVLYDEKENVLFRSLIHSYQALGAMSAQSITLNVTENAFKKSEKFKIEEVPVSTYPEVNLVEKEGEYEVLTCKYNHNTIKYYFKENKLEKIYDEYKQAREESYNYDANKEKYRTLSNQYKEVPNFSSTFIETDVDFQLINEFDLKQITDAQLTSLRTYRFFKYNESKDVVNFEIESQAYTCS